MSGKEGERDGSRQWNHELSKSGWSKCACPPSLLTNMIIMTAIRGPVTLMTINAQVTGSRCSGQCNDTTALLYYLQIFRVKAPTVAHLITNYWSIIWSTDKRLISTIHHDCPCQGIHWSTHTPRNSTGHIQGHLQTHTSSRVAIVSVALSAKIASLINVKVRERKRRKSNLYCWPVFAWKYHYSVCLSLRIMTR